MPLSKKELEALMEQIGLTRDQEIDCDQCLSQVAEFAEHHLAGQTIPHGLKAVQHHLAICGECREEYEALQRALDAIAPGADDSGAEPPDHS